MELLYNIGFAGLSKGSGYEFRSAGARTTTPPPISTKSRISIHQSYRDALNLHDQVVAKLDESVLLRTTGLVDLPEGSTLDEYQKQLEDLSQDLATMPRGPEGSTAFEDMIGTMLKLCFFRYLTNVEPRMRDIDGIKIRDWICSNSAQTGFWEMIRMKYGATQVIWECKNYDKLKADDYHQAQYYMNDEMGHCVVIAFRGNDVAKNDYKHIRKIASDSKGIVLPVTQRDLEVFLRQAQNGKYKDSHIRDIYDKIVRKIS